MTVGVDNNWRSGLSCHGRDVAVGETVTGSGGQFEKDALLCCEDRILLRVWERGVGETLACGTGACATLVAATLACLAGRSATIELPGGELDIRWDEDGHVYMTGPAREVFTGTVLIPEEEDA